jgi:hypothetical protein
MKKLVILILMGLLLTMTQALAKKGDNPGGGGKVLDTLSGQFISTPLPPLDVGFTVTDPLLTTGGFSMASNDEFKVFLSCCDEEKMELGGLLVRVKGGKATGVLVFLSEGDFAQGGSSVYETGMLPIDPAVPVSAAGFTLHVHANHVPLKSGRNKPPIGWISIGDLVFTPTP